MTLTAEERLAIHETISRHGHLFDEGRLGSVGSTTYVGTLRCAGEAWRISHRVVLARRRPVGSEAPSEPSKP